jgi:hypothetical protein
MKILINDKFQEINLVPFITRNVQRKMTEIAMQSDTKKELLRKEYKDVIVLMDNESESGINVKKFVEAKSKNKNIESRFVEFGNKIKDIDLELLYKQVIIATNHSLLSPEVKHYFVDFDNLNSNSKLSKEEILDFWENHTDVRELSEYLDTFRKFL